MDNLLNFLSNNSQQLAPVITAIAVIVAAWTLRANHEWNRRQYAMNMISEWNSRTAVHRKAIEKAIPGLIDIDKKSNSVAEVSKDRAKAIYGSKPHEPDWELRFHLIELGNYFEFVASTYTYHVGDRKMIEEAFKGPLTVWHKVLQNFIEVVRENRGYDPWPPFSDVVKIWDQPKKAWLWRRTGP